MKKCKISICLLFVMLLAFLLQGCSADDLSSITTPSTNHEIVMDKHSASKFEIKLTAEMAQKYEWYVFDPDDHLDKTGEKFKKGLFNDTYMWNYGYMVRNDQDDFYFYLILVKDGDLETCKAYPIRVHFGESNISLIEEKSFKVSGDKKFYKEVSQELVLTTSY